MYPLVACVGRVGRRTPRFWVERGEKNLISGSGTQFYVQLLFFWHPGRFLCPLNRSVGQKIGGYLVHPRGKATRTSVGTKFEFEKSRFLQLAALNPSSF